MQNVFRQLANRVCQLIARSAPGATSVRVWLHRLRGVRIGKGVWIGYDTVIETSKPHLVSIGNNVTISIRVLIIAHFRDTTGVRIEDGAFIGPGVIILPNVTIGRGSVVTAGSVVGTSVPAESMVQGNPARVIAKCTVPLEMSTSMAKFYGGLRLLHMQGAPSLQAQGSRRRE